MTGENSICVTDGFSPKRSRWTMTKSTEAKRVRTRCLVRNPALPLLPIRLGQDHTSCDRALSPAVTALFVDVSLLIHL